MRALKSSSIIVVAAVTAQLAACDTSPPAVDAQVDPSDANGSDAASDASMTDAPPILPDAFPPSDAHPPSPDASPADDGIPTGDGIVTIIAPSKCTLLNHKLLNCNFSPVTVVAPTPSSAAPYETRIEAHQMGNCSSPFATEIRISGDALEPQTYTAFQQAAVIVMHTDGAMITSLQLENASPFPGTPAYDESCRIWLQIEFNLPAATPP